MDLTEQARNAYSEMVSLIEKEVAELPRHMTGGAAGSGSVYPQIYAHMGHSRTPSACSAISFSSSILSEPISENYPHSEPETDSRGYEIVKVATKDAMTRDASKAAANNNAALEKTATVSVDSTMRGKQTVVSETVYVPQDTKRIVENLNEIDEGNEADTEDVMDTVPRSNRPRSNSAARGTANSEENREVNHGKESRGVVHVKARDSSFSCSDDETGDEDEEEEEGEDVVGKLPHIDSVHSSVVDLQSEILSQHSSKTVDVNAEVLSTHSSRTLGEATSPTATAAPAAASGGASAITEVSVDDKVTAKVRPIDKERMIESWVAETREQMERLKVNEETDAVHLSKSKHSK